MTRFRARRTAAAALAAASFAVAALAGCGLRDLGSRDDPPDGGDPAELEVSWEAAAAAIEGIVDYRETRPELLGTEHVQGPVPYEVLPPVGGQHNEAWQDCDGQVYDAPVANEHAVHSLEHGAVWVTYHPSLPADQVESLADRVRATDHTLLSPFPDLDSPISLQAWGYQLKLDSADDPRIDEFIRALAVNAGPEPGGPCTGGVTTTGTEPIA